MFDVQNSFDQNLAAFKMACEELDAECAQILFDNIGILITHGGDRDARTRFNAKVSAALDTLPTAEQME